MAVSRLDVDSMLWTDSESTGHPELRDDAETRMRRQQNNTSGEARLKRDFVVYDLKGSKCFWINCWFEAAVVYQLKTLVLLARRQQDNVDAARAGRRQMALKQTTRKREEDVTAGIGALSLNSLKTVDEMDVDDEPLVLGEAAAVELLPELAPLDEEMTAAMFADWASLDEEAMTEAFGHWRPAEEAEEEATAATVFQEWSATILEQDFLSTEAVTTMNEPL